jgi:ethanolamine ammonia-lyase small subunit
MTAVDKNILDFACDKLRQAMSNPVAVNRYILLKKIERARINTWAAGNRRK